MKIIFVCTGNTCRSPMAEIVCKHQHPDWGVISAGLHAFDGYPASENAMIAVKNIGLSLDKHCTQVVSQSLMNWADKVYALSNKHKQNLSDSFPNSADKIFLLDDIPEPFGGDLEIYQQCLQQIVKAVELL